MNLLDFMHALGRSSLAAALLVLLVLAAQKVFRRQLSPQWQCALWLLVMVRLVPFSFSSVVSVFNLLPAWERSGSSGLALSQPVVPLPSAAPRGMGSLPVLDESTVNEQGQADRATAPAPSPSTASADFHLNPATSFVAVWLTGVLMLGGYVAVTSLRFARRIARLTPLIDPATLAILRAGCVQLGVRRPPQIFESGAVTTPALHGFFRARLLLPRGFTTAFSAAELRFVFLHELAHLRRRDLVLNWAATCLQIVHWFNPLVWFAFARWRIDREIACDALALEAAGGNRQRDYGCTMLRLLENFTTRGAQPGLIGILESKRQLQRRMREIAHHTPARRPVVAIALLALLASVGLTDAQVEPLPQSAISPAPTSAAPPPTPVSVPPQSFDSTVRGKHVLFLVSASGSMLDDTVDTAAARLGDIAEKRREAPKWQRVLHSLQWTLTTLEPDAHFQIVFFNDEATSILPARSGEWLSLKDQATVREVVSRMKDVAPQGGSNLERAFTSIRLLPELPDRIVLLTDGLPTRSDSIPLQGDTDAAARVRFFEVAAKQLPPRIPVSTILFPLSRDPGVAGKYWELANATRGVLVSPSPAGPAKPTHLAFVIDTSGSMRDPNSGGVWPIAGKKITEVLELNPEVTGVQLLDADGRFILGRQGQGMAAWLANTRETREQIIRVLNRYSQDTISNPVPGIYNALRFLKDPDASAQRMAIYVFGDEFVETAQPVLDRLDQLNPRGPDGRRPVVINAIGFPTTIRYNFSMGNTGNKFADLMRQIAQEHDGTFVLLPDL